MTQTPRNMSACGCCSPILGRRGFLAGAAAFTALAASGASPQAFAQGAPHRIDVHHHVSPPAWVGAMKKAKLDSPPVNNWTPQKSLEDMDKAGVATAMLSPTQPALTFLGAQDAASIARDSNEYTKKLTQEHKGRFGMFALLPMPHVDATLKEIEYALDVLKADGVAFMTNSVDKYLGDKEFAPIMDELNRRKVTAYTHPNTHSCCVNLAGLPAATIEWGTDTTRTIASLIFSRTSQRCPDINFIFSHGGGTLTSVTERFTLHLLRMPEYKAWTADEVWKEIRRFYYDTAQFANPIAMAALTKMVDASQIVFGTDYPYRTSDEHVKGLGAIFSPEDLKKIDRENALRLLPQWRA